MRTIAEFIFDLARNSVEAGSTTVRVSVEEDPESNVFRIVIEPIDDVENGDDDDFGLMSSFVDRWRSRLPEVLAAGAGAEIHIPPGNDDLIELLEPYARE